MKLERPVTITPTAATEIANLLSVKKIPEGYFLRITVKGSSGCGGATPTLGFDKMHPNDDCYLIEGLEVIIDKRHLIYVLGYEIDFVESESERGFVLTKS